MPRSSTRTAARLAAALAALLLSPLAASAQPGPVKSPIRLEFTVNGGVLAPAGTLVQDGELSTGGLELSEDFAFGGGVGVLLPGGLTLEGQLLFAPGSSLERTGEQIVGGESEQAVSDAEFLALTGNLIYRLPLPLVQPYFGAGAGMKRLSFDDGTVLGTDDDSQFTGEVLVGTYVSVIPGLTLRAEARDYLSSFTDPRTDESEFQNDLAFLAGLSWRIP